jgi:hypothetical protein
MAPRSRIAPAVAALLGAPACGVADEASDPDRSDVEDVDRRAACAAARPGSGRIGGRRQPSRLGGIGDGVFMGAASGTAPLLAAQSTGQRNRRVPERSFWRQVGDGRTTGTVRALVMGDAGCRPEKDEKRTSLFVMRSHGGGLPRGWSGGVLGSPGNVAALTAARRQRRRRA